MFNELKETIQHFLEETKVNYQFKEGCNTFRVNGINDNEVQHNLDMFITMDDDQILFYDFLFFDSELFDKGEFLKMLNKINLNIENGQFIYDAEKNDIECRSYLSCYGIIPSFEMIEDGFNAIKRLMEKFGPFIKYAAEVEPLTQTALEELLEGESSDGVVY